MTESTYDDNTSPPAHLVGSDAVPSIALLADAAALARVAQMDAHHSAVLADLQSLGPTHADLVDEWRNPYGWSREQFARFLAGYRQRELEWQPRAAARNAARQELADYLERVVVPSVGEWQHRERLALIVDRLRLARGWAELKYSASEDRWMTVWEQKADLPLLCPDDANEEFRRLSSRYLDTLLEWLEGGGRIYTMVLTAPHAEPGTLHEAMRARMKETKRLLDALPQVRGSMLVMECPLAALRRWNVHVNVLVLTDGYLPYADVRRHWVHNAHMDLIAGGEAKPFAELRGNRELVEGALRELIKYAVRTTGDKSMDEGKRAKARAEGRMPAPAMVQYSAAEWLEWWQAHRKFRRTRTYGALYKVGKPPPQDLEGFVPVGQVVRQAGSYSFRSVLARAALLNSIQWDNFSAADQTRQHGASRGENQRARGPPD